MNFTLDAGTVLHGRYRLAEPIAVGGQGEVWRAEDISLGRPVAVKVLRGEYSGDPEFRTRFRSEALHAAGLSHPGIAQVFDYEEGGGGSPCYLVMEYVDGESLSATIAREAPLSPGRVLDIVVAVASALAAAHAAGLVHRDVKPGNLLVGRDGSIKITDFGIARAVDAVPLTKTGMIMGTPLYLSPEQAWGRQATAASDLYALGVIAYELLTARRPYEGSPAAVLLAHRDTPLPPLPASVPPGVAGLVHALTAKDPEARPGSATAVADRASRLRADPARTALEAPLAAHAQPGNLTRPQARPVAEEPSWWRRRALLLSALAVVLVAGLVTALAWPSPQRPATLPRPPATPARSPSADARVPATMTRTPAVHAPPGQGRGADQQPGKDKGKDKAKGKSGKHKPPGKHKH
jgi:eukaryotic-like serine/threonine-protein kinase